MEYHTTDKLKRLRKAMQLAFTVGLAIFLVITFLWGLSGTTPALADPGDLYVDGASGGDNPSCGTTSAPCQTISYTLNIRASEGDALHIGEGTYVENLVIDSVTVTLRGGYTISGSNWLPDTGETIVDGDNADRTFVIKNNNSVLEDLTITGGYASNANPEGCWGGGVWVTNGEVTIRSSTITDNAADCGAAGVDVNNDFGDAHLILESCTISHNKGGGQYGGLDIWGDSTTAEVRDTIIYSNTAEYGGGIVVAHGASAVITGTRILSNTANDQGGGVYLTDGPTVVMTDSLISGNISTGDGAGLYTQDGATVRMHDVEIANNGVLTSTEWGQGGGLYFRGGTQAVLTNLRIHGNTAAEGGGGLYFDDDPTTVTISDSWIANNTAIGGFGNSGGGLGANQGSLTITNCTIEGNSTPNNHGGGLFAKNGGSIDVFDSKILDNNTKDHGGAIHTDQGSVSLTNVLIAGNQTSSGDANVLSIDDSDVTIMNSTISDNNPGGAQGVLLWSGELTVTNSILWDNALNLQADPPCPGCFSVNYTNIEGSWPGTENKNEDPLFLGGGNYHLGIGSPCIDEGTPAGAPTHDIEGTGRDALPDMGAYEFKLFDLTVSLEGSGSGSVSSSPVGIDCGTDCGESYANGTILALTAITDTGSTFEGWSGACSGISECTITMTETKAVTATFAINQYNLSVSLTGMGSGSVSSTPAGIDCGTSCSESFDYGTVVTLTATADGDSIFDGWSGACSGISDCTVAVTETKMVTATFAIAQHDLSVSLEGTGGGSVSSTPAGIDCGTSCTESFDYGTVVTLTATGDAGSIFGGWSGACSGISDCIITMTETKTVTATFILSDIYLPLVVR